MKKVIGIAMILLLIASVGIAAAEYTGPPVKAKLASEEIEGDFMTVWAKNFSDHMKKWSDGKIDISVYPYAQVTVNTSVSARWPPPASSRLDGRVALIRSTSACSSRSTA